MNSLYPLLLTCKYSFEPNKLGYCGQEGAFEVFSDFIHDPMAEKVAKVEGLLKSFYGVHAYLDLIAANNGLEAFDERVVRAYWIGNELLGNSASEDLSELIIEEFTKPGLLPMEFAEKLASSVPAAAVPHHSFHVLHVNFINPKVKKIVENIDSCLVKWAKVKSVEGGSLLVKGISLLNEGGELKLLEKEKRIALGFSFKPKPGDYVAEHWGAAVEVIDEEKLSNLKKYTKINLDAANQH